MYSLLKFAAFFLLTAIVFFSSNYRTSSRKLQEKFNIFKSYKNARLKPPQYSHKRFSKHATDEYLSPLQKMMLAARKGKDTPDVMFDKNWSGFKNNRFLRGT